MTCNQPRDASPVPPEGESSAWVTDGTGVHPGGDAGGDIQAGEAYSIRYRRVGRPCAMITRTAYPAEAVGHQGVFFVQIQTEWLVCSDPLNPGGTEVWSDNDVYDQPGIYSSAAEAGVAARQIATDLLDDGASHDWEGLPPQWADGEHHYFRPERP